MKAKAIVATLLVAAVTRADARFAPPYPRKAVSPDGSGAWIVMNGDAWSHSTESDPIGEEPGRNQGTVQALNVHSASPAPARLIGVAADSWPFFPANQANNEKTY